MKTGGADRSDAIDVLKGIGIFFVVANHCFARGSQKFGPGPVTDDPLLYFVNRLIHFAVPMFLFVSCALLARSVAARRKRRAGLGGYWKARARKTFVPYLVASTAYFWLYEGAPWATPEAVRRFAADVAFGQASFHLYFTLVLLQVAVATPILVSALGDRPLDARWALAVAVPLQAAAYVLQRELWRLDRPGSWLAWYLVPLLVGIAAGTDREFKARVLRRGPVVAAAVVVLGLAYSAASVAHLVGGRASSDAINGLYAAYTGALAVGLWAAADRWPSGAIRRFFRGLGRVSLPLFLIHPALMHLLGGPTATVFLARWPAPGFVYWVLVLGLSYGLAVAVSHTRLGQAILGEESPSASTAA